MADREIDAQAVLESYGKVLEQGGGLIRSVSELPYPKEVIKQVLNHCLRLADPSSRDFLTTAYMQLAAFVPLSSDERIAVKPLRRALRHPS